MTAEDKARALLGRMGIDGPFSSGELVELANLIADHDHQSRVLKQRVTNWPRSYHRPETKGPLELLEIERRRRARLLPHMR